MKLIVLAGEGGIRLFPLARANHPKEFLKIFDDTSLFVQSIMRYAPVATAEDVVVVTGQKYQYHVKSELESCGMGKAHVVLETEFKGTAPAIALGLNYCKNQLGAANDEIIFITVSDHIINPTNVFLRNMRSGLPLCGKGKIVHFGVKPDKPETSYAYIKTGDKIEDGYAVEKFIEKPDYDKAAEFYSSGDYYWNAGIQAAQLDTFLAAFEKTVPDIASLISKPLEKAQAEFVKLGACSVNKAVWEKAENMAVIPLNCFWNDIGSWDDIYDILIKDEDGNAEMGNVLAVDCKDSMFIGKKRFITSVGMSDTLVVETGDVILVAKRGEADKVKELAKILEEKGCEESKHTNTVYRHWGNFTVLDAGKNFRVKNVVMLPGSSMPMQMHCHRSEHWVIVEGSAKVIIDGDEHMVHKNQSIFVPIGTKHKIINAGMLPLEMVEVQNGDYLGEDDVTIFADEEQGDD